MPTLVPRDDGSVVWDYDLPANEGDAPSPGSKAALVARAEALGLSTGGTKADLEQRIAEATVEPAPVIDPAALVEGSGNTGQES